MARVLFLVCLMAVGTAAVRAADHNVLVNTRYCTSDTCKPDTCKMENKRDATGNCEPGKEKGHVKSYKATCNSTHYSYTTYTDDVCGTVDSSYTDVELGCERVVIPANLALTDGGNYTLDLCRRLHRPKGDPTCDGCGSSPKAEFAPSKDCKDSTFGYLNDVSYKTEDDKKFTLYRGKGCTGQKLFAEVATTAVKCVALEDVMASSKCILANGTTTTASPSAASAIPVVGAALGLLLLSSLLL